MKFYIRKLNAQELGYREGRIREAGRYILVSKRLQKEIGFFPRFPKDKIEPSTAVGCINSVNNILVYCEYVWHNGSAHRGKDLRLYLNEDIDPLNTFFNVNDYVVFFKFENDGENLFRLYRFNPADREYKSLEDITKEASIPSHHWVNNLDFINQNDRSFSNLKISNQTLRRVEERIGDPNENTLSPSEFKPIIRSIYQYKCAVTNTFINPSHYWNLQASHIKPDSHQGPFRPDNGILLNRDMHWAFDYGCFTLNDNLEVVVHEQIKDSSLNEFNGNKINLPEKKEFHPNLEYVKYHRKNIFGRLKPLRNN